jgi:hypothetical protein
MVKEERRYDGSSKQQSTMINVYTGGGSGGVNLLCVFNGGVKKRGGI